MANDVRKILSMLADQCLFLLSQIPQSFILVGYQHSPEAPGLVLIPKELAALFRQSS